MMVHFKTPDVLSKEECDRIIAEARQLAAASGIKCEGTTEFNDLLSSFGCVLDQGRICFPPRVVEAVFARIEAEAVSPPIQTDHPPRRPRVADLPVADYRGDDLPIGCGVSGQADLICDLNAQLRPCAVDDLARFSRLVDQHAQVEWHHPGLIPQDAPLRTREIHAYATIALNNSQLRLVSAYSAEAVKHFMEISIICLGSQAEARRKAPFIHSLWINTPFTLCKEVVAGAMEVRRVLGRPLKVVTMPVAGASTPVTLAGCLVQGTAEVIIENIITLAVDNRLNGYFCAPLAMDVRRGLITTGPETDLVRMASVNVARQMFRNDRYVFQAFGLGTMAKRPGAQSMMEKSLAAVFALLCGARIFGGLATLSFSDVISPVQFLLDLELVNQLTRFDRGITVDDATLATELIRRVAPEGASYLGDSHTLAHYAGEQWLPALMDRRIAKTWSNDPRAMLDNAAAKARELWEKAPNQCPLTETQKREISKVLAAADRELA